MEKYVLKDRLGEGSYGVVWKATNETNTLAIKIISGVNYFLKEQVESEIDIMIKLSHPNLIKIHQSHYDQPSQTFYIVMDYCQQGDLLRYISSKNKELSCREIMQIFKQLVEAFIFMTGKGVIHRDLKPQNILIANGNCIKVADFGCAQHMKSDEVSKLICMSLDKGTPCFASPELLQSQAYSYKCDVWSAGCIIYFLTYKKLPFFAKKVSQIIQLIKERTQNKDIQLPYGPGVPPASPELQYIIKRCLKFREIERATWRELNLCRLFAQKLSSVRQYCEYVKSLSNIANWISKMFWKERKGYKIKQNKEEIFVYFIIKFQLSILQLGQRVMERDSDYKYMFEEYAWNKPDIDEVYYKHFKDIHLKETTEYFTMLRDCPKSQLANKTIREKESGLLTPFADLQNSIRCAYRILNELTTVLGPKHPKVFAVMARWVNFQRHFEIERKPNLEKILDEKAVSVSEEVQYEISNSIGGSM